MSGRRAQRGAALLVMFAILAMGASWWLVSRASSLDNRLALERARNGPVLQQARQALIAWAALQAATDDLNPGRLPCPEAAGNIGTANEGIAAGVCTLPAVGRLPWRTLGIDKLRDAAGEPLWYIVSPGWAMPNSSTPTLGINSNSAGNLTVDGRAHAAVALIIAPGAPLVLTPNANQLAAGCAARAQVRNPAAPNYRDYLECQNVGAASLRTTIVDNAANPVSNDQMTAVSAADVLAAVEPVVALRVQRDVVPQLQAIYASSAWGSGISAANPLFPFAAAFGDPASSAFTGTAGTTQGLLPVSSAVCNTMTNGPCDPNFVQWNAGSVALSPASGANWTSSCAASTASELRCDITYSRTCVSGASGTCSVNPGNATLSAQAANVGNAMRQLNTAVITNFGTPTMSAPLTASGAANAAIQGTLPSASCSMSFSSSSWTCTVATTIQVRVPISVFQDHPFLSAAGPTPASTGTTPVAWFWFLANKWHHVTYYAVAPLHAPGGAGNCSATSCISVTVQGASSLDNKRAVLALAGRSLIGTSGSNRALGDFLDSAQNTDLDLVFEQKRPSKFFNDRFVALSP